MSELKIFTCNTFAGHWPVGASAVMVADSAERAFAMLMGELSKRGLASKNDDLGVSDLVELDVSFESFLMLQDGEY